MLPQALPGRSRNDPERLEARLIVPLGIRQPCREGAESVGPLLGILLLLVGVLAGAPASASNCKGLAPTVFVSGIREQ